MTRDQAKEILLILHVDSGKPPSNAKVDAWWGELSEKKVPYALGVAGAKRMRKLTRSYGEPQWADYREHVNALYRAAKAVAQGLKPIDPAIRSRMSAKDAEKRMQLLEDAKEIKKSQALIASVGKRLEMKGA